MAPRRVHARLAQAAVAVLVLIVLVYAAMRMRTDVRHLSAGTVPPNEVDRAFVAHPWLAYLHIAPGVVYLLGAPLQLAYRFRSRHYTVHRRLGRVLLSAALLSGVFAIVFGVLFPYGGLGETAATVVFGAWFLRCLVSAFRTIRQGDVVQHRRWMIRAFVVALGVGTIRIWIGVLSEFGIMGFQDSFAVSFWISFVIHVVAAEWWIRTTPHPSG